MLSNALAVVFALASAIVIAWGTVVRQRIVEQTPSAIVRTAVQNPLWWMGTCAAVIAYGLQIIALGFGTLLLVQPMLVLSLMFTLSLAAWYQGRRLSAAETTWSLILTAAVAVLVVLGKPADGVVRPPLDAWLPALSFGVGAMILCALASAWWPAHRALLLGVVCGGIYGYVAVLSKSVVDIFITEGLGSLLGDWTLYALILSAGTGTVVQQYSFHAGPLKHSLPAMTIVEPIVAFSLGYAVLSEKFQVTSIGGWVLMGAALLAMVTATSFLAQQPVNASPKVTHAAAPARSSSAS